MSVPYQPSYEHRQAGPWGVLLLAFAVATAAAAWFGRGEPVAPLFLAPLSLLILGLAACFQHLDTVDEGDHLAVRFGPIPLFRTRVRYDEIEAADPGRTTTLDGWGIHRSLRGGWVWNIWGYDCVAIRRGGRLLRVGTDDAEGLAAFLRRRVGPA